MKILKRSIAILLILIGLIFIFNKPITEWFVKHFGEETQLTGFTKEIGEINRDEISAISNFDLMRKILKRDQMNYVGAVSVPSIGLSINIINELNNDSLSIASAVYYDDMVMGMDNYVLASHFAYGSQYALFSPLYYQINTPNVIGSNMYLTDGETIFTYRVTTYKIVDNSDVDYIQQGTDDPMLTLFTCNYTHEQGKIILQGELIDKKSSDDYKENEIKKMFLVND